MTNNINPNTSEIERVVMRRVHTISLLRPFVSAGALAALMLALALWGIGREVWVAHVFANAPHAGVVALGRFYFAAFEHTKVVVQALVLTGLGAALIFAQALLRPVAGALAPRLA